MVIKPEPVPEIVFTGIETPADVTLWDRSYSDASIMLSIAASFLVPSGYLGGDRLEARCCEFCWI